MSKAGLKKQLANMTADQLRELVLELYDIRKEAKEYLDYWANPDPRKAVEKAEKEVRRVFYTSLTTPRRRPALSDLNTIVRHFMTLALDRDLTAEFLLYVAETECEWLEQRWRRLSYRTSMLKNLDSATLFLENAYNDAAGEEEVTDKTVNPALNPYQIRLERLQDRVHSLFYHY